LPDRFIVDGRESWFFAMLWRYRETISFKLGQHAANFELSFRQDIFMVGIIRELQVRKDGEIIFSA
jgi:hypothetical protein